MRKNKKQRRVMFLLILILSITIGFALLSTTLKINGSASIKSNTWNIHWDDSSIVVNPNSVEAEEPEVSTTTSAKDTVSFDVELEVPGDYFEFEIDAVNEGSVDGALDLAENWITYKVEDQETTLPEYMDFKVTYDDDTNPTTGDVLKASESKTYKIRVEFKSSVEELPENPESLTIEVELPYVQHKEETSSSWVLPAGKTKDNLEAGDELCIKTECFYVISTNDQKTILLAKNNLLVGNIIENRYQIIGEISPTTPGYGLQSEEATGQKSGDNWKGTVPFSSTRYWDGKTEDGQKYTCRTADYYCERDEQYSYLYIYDENSLIYNYIGDYVNTLKTFGASSSITGRILSYNEANTAKNIEDDGVSIIFNGRQSYWIGGWHDNDSVNGYYVGQNYITTYNYFDDWDAGIKPVIEVPTSDFNN